MIIGKRKYAFASVTVFIIFGLAMYLLLRSMAGMGANVGLRVFLVVVLALIWAFFQNRLRAHFVRDQ